MSRHPSLFCLIATLLLAVTLTLASALPSAAAPRSGAPPRSGQGQDMPADPHEDEGPVIDDVLVQAGSEAARPGEMVRVYVQGTSSCVATFDVAGLQDGMRLTEVEAGRYEGSFVVPKGATREVRVRVHLSMEGQQATQSARLAVADTPTPQAPPATNPPASGPPPESGPPASGPPPASGFPADPHRIFINITSPAPGERVGSDFALTGTTLPYAQVEVTARLSQSLLPGVTIGTQRQRATGVADARGCFCIPMHFSAGGNNVALRVVVTNPVTSRSRVTEFTVGRRH